MRKLVTIRKVASVLPIEGSDYLELCKVDGWQCVVNKNTFKPGDLGVYHEIDSMIEPQPRYEFLRARSLKKLNGQEFFVLRTVKLLGQLSQGLLLPLKEFPELDMPLEVGMDVTDILNIKKYDPADFVMHLSGVAKGLFPHYIPKTDQERIQNLPEYLSDYFDKEFEVSLKLDGSSVTIFCDTCDNEVKMGVCTRNLELLEDYKNSVWKVVKDNGILDILKEACISPGKAIALQGEFVKNPKGGNKFFLFDIYSIWAQEYFSPKERMFLLNKLNEIALSKGLPKISHVPIIKNGTIRDILYNGADKVPSDPLEVMSNLLEYAEVHGINIDSEEFDDSVGEGLVFKSEDHINNLRLVSFKAINNNFLLSRKKKK